MFWIGMWIFQLAPHSDLCLLLLKRLNCRQGAIKPRSCARVRLMILSPTPPNWDAKLRHHLGVYIVQMLSLGVHRVCRAPPVWLHFQKLKPSTAQLCNPTPRVMWNPQPLVIIKMSYSDHLAVACWGLQLRKATDTKDGETRSASELVFQVFSRLGKTSPHCFAYISKCHCFLQHLLFLFFFF